MCCYLTDEPSGGALSNPEAELPLLPLPHLSFCTGGDEHWILVYQGLMKNLETQAMLLCMCVCLSTFLNKHITSTRDATVK